MNSNDTGPGPFFATPQKEADEPFLAARTSAQRRSEAEEVDDLLGAGIQPPPGLWPAIETQLRREGVLE
ncbi:MAG: hypothetical protein D6731_23030 [Planctomycetota bacterium]|nr:MAG: hypothetical protein D6731_23030 [Planctomycetota bacterium]